MQNLKKFCQAAYNKRYIKIALSSKHGIINLIKNDAKNKRQFARNITKSQNNIHNIKEQNSRINTFYEEKFENENNNLIGDEKDDYNEYFEKLDEERNFFWAEVKFMETIEKLEDFYIKNKRFYTPLGYAVTFNRLTRVINSKIQINQKEIVANNKGLIDTKLELILNSEITKNMIDSINNTKIETNGKDLALIGASMYRMGFEFGNSLIKNQEIKAKSDEFLGSFFDTYLERYKELDLVTMSVESFLFVLSNKDLVKSPDDRMWVIDTMIQKRVYDQTQDFTKYTQLLSVLKSLWNDEYVNLRVTRDFQLDIENQMIDHVEHLPLEYILEILGVYATSKTKSMNLDQFDAISTKLGFLVEKLSFSEIAKVLTLITKIGEDRIHFQSMVARIVVERQTAYEDYLDFKNSEDLYKIKALEKFDGLITKFPSENLLYLEGKSDLIESMKNLDYVEELKNVDVGDFGYEIFKEEHWDSVKKSDKFLSGGSLQSAFGEEEYDPEKEREILESISMNPEDHAYDKYRDPDYIEENMDDLFKIEDISTILYCMSKLSFFQDQLYLTLNKVLCQTIHQGTALDIYRFAYSHSKYSNQKLSEIEDGSYYKRSKKNVTKFHDEFYLALAPTIMGKQDDQEPYQINEIFISATRPNLKNFTAKRVMVGLCCEALKSIAKKQSDQKYSEKQKYFLRNSYYQILKVSKKFCYNDIEKSRINQRLAKDRIDIKKLLHEQGQHIVGYHIQELAFIDLKNESKGFFLDENAIPATYFTIKEPEVNYTNQLESDTITLTKNKEDYKKDFSDESGADSYHNGVPFYDQTKEN